MGLVSLSILLWPFVPSFILSRAAYLNHFLHGSAYPSPMILHLNHLSLLLYPNKHFLILGKCSEAMLITAVLAESLARRIVIVVVIIVIVPAVLTAAVIIVIGIRLLDIDVLKLKHWWRAFLFPGHSKYVHTALTPTVLHQEAL